MADNLARQGFGKLRFIDCDRIEQHNVSTQLYDEADIGAWKVEILRNRLFRACEVEAETDTTRLDAKNAKKLLQGSDIVIDAFDNSASRAVVGDCCREQKLECLHVGLFQDYCEVIWDQDYRVPGDVAGDVCEYPLARNLVLLAVALASETIVQFVANGTRQNRSATSGDFAVREIESGFCRKE